jgi:hypothetical protein
VSLFNKKIYKYIKLKTILLLLLFKKKKKKKKRKKGVVAPQVAPATFGVARCHPTAIPSFFKNNK